MTSHDGGPEKIQIYIIIHFENWYSTTSVIYPLPSFSPSQYPFSFCEPIDNFLFLETFYEILIKSKTVGCFGMRGKGDEISIQKTAHKELNFNQWRPHNLTRNSLVRPKYFVTEKDKNTQLTPINQISTKERVRNNF